MGGAFGPEGGAFEGPLGGPLFGVFGPVGGSLDVLLGVLFDALGGAVLLLLLLLEGSVERSSGVEDGPDGAGCVCLCEGKGRIDG